MLEVMPQTKEEVMGWCSGNENEDVEEESVQRNSKLELSPSAAKELYNRFKILDSKYYIVSFSMKIYHKNQDYQKATDMLDIEVVQEEEIKDGSIEKIAPVNHGLFSYA